MCTRISFFLRAKKLETFHGQMMWISAAFPFLFISVHTHALNLSNPNQICRHSPPSSPPNLSGKQNNSRSFAPQWTKVLPARCAGEVVGASGFNQRSHSLVARWIHTMKGLSNIARMFLVALWKKPRFFSLFFLSFLSISDLIFPCLQFFFVFFFFSLFLRWYFLPSRFWCFFLAELNVAYVFYYLFIHWLFFVMANVSCFFDFWLVFFFHWWLTAPYWLIFLF